MTTTTSRWTDIRRQLHQIPEPGFEEFKTQQFLLDFIATLPQNRLEVKTWRTGILVHVRGRNPKRRIGYRADMDGLPITENTSYPFKSTHPGFMHACGHDLHMTIGLGVLTHFVEHEIDDDLVVIFQPAEEGPGGALPMMGSEVFQAWKPDLILALHIAPEYPVGTVAIRPGILFANTCEFFVNLVGTGGHAAFPHRANDMVVAAAHLVTQLQTIISRNVNPLDSAVITVGKIEGGTRLNIIAEQARLEGTIRTLSKEAMDMIKSRIESVVSGVGTAFGCEAVVEYGSSYCQVWNHEALTTEFMHFVRDCAVADLVECREAMTGEDFGYFVDQIPGFLFWLGADTAYGLHHSKIEPSEDALEVAIRVATRYIEWKSAQ